MSLIFIFYKVAAIEFIKDGHIVLQISSRCRIISCCDFLFATCSSSSRYNFFVFDNSFHFFNVFNEVRSIFLGISDEFMLYTLISRPSLSWVLYQTFRYEVFE